MTGSPDSPASGTAGEYRIVRYHDGLKDQVLALQQHLWGPHAAINRSYFEWKYHANPYLPHPVAAVALQQDRVVGMRGLFGGKWRVGAQGPTVVLPFTDDLVIAPAHRDRGLARRLIEATLQYAADLGYPMVVSLRAGPLTLMASLAAGFRSLGAMEPESVTSPSALRWRKLRDFLGHQRFLWRWSNAPALFAPGEKQPFRHLDRAARHPGSPDHPQVGITSAPRVEAMIGLLERLPSDDRIRHVRDAQYLEWVFRNPRLEFRFLYWGDRQLEGYLVLHRVRTDLGHRGRVEVADGEATSDAVRSGLLETAVRCGKFPELVTWTATMPPRIRNDLDRLGFLPTDLEARSRGRPAALLCATGSHRDEENWTLGGRAVGNLDNWKIRLLDQD